MIALTEKEEKARQRICLALDVPSVQKALNLAAELAPYVGTFKIGKQLHTSAGNEGINIIEEIHKRGGNIFLDLKLHDTPQTVYEASKASAVPGVFVFNVHVAGGKHMCEAALKGAKDGAKEQRIESPKVIGVTVLTSLSDEDLQEQNLSISYNHLVLRRTTLAKEWGLDGIVCPASKAGALEKEFGSDFLYITPGIKWADHFGTGQKQLYTPEIAVQDCSSSLLVIGSAITKAKNKQETAYAIVQAMAQYM